VTAKQIFGGFGVKNNTFHDNPHTNLNFSGLSVILGRVLFWNILYYPH